MRFLAGKQISPKNYFLIIKCYFVVSGHVGYQESEERESLIDNMLNGAKMGQYNNLLESLAKHMTSKVFHRIKTFVRGKLDLNYFHFHISTMCCLS